MVKPSLRDLRWLTPNIFGLWMVAVNLCICIARLPAGLGRNLQAPPVLFRAGWRRGASWVAFRVTEITLVIPIAAPHRPTFIA